MSETKYDLAVAYRIYPKISKKPAIFSDDKYKLTEFCLKSFKQSLGPLKIKFFAILDNCPAEYEELLKKYYDENELVIIKQSGIGNKATFGLQINLLIKQKFSNIIYFAEDDYYYFPNQFEKMILFLKKYSDVDFITPYDHLDYSISDFHKYKYEKRIYKNKMWRTVNSTCLTFLTTKQTLQKTKKVLNLYARGLARDTSIFLALTKFRLFNPFVIFKFYVRNRELFRYFKMTWGHAWRQILFGRKRKVWCPKPTIATHIESSRLAPEVDWSEVFSKEVKNLRES
ncbi:MAG: glycosyltransferase family 2 protein [Promethearchaeota archaeon]